MQFDLFEPRLPVPVGYGQRRRAWVLVAALCFSRVMAGALVFSKEAHDVLWALGRCLGRLGGLRGCWSPTGRAACTRARAGRRMSTPPSAGSWRSAGISAIRVTRRPRGLSRTANGSFARALSRGGRSPTICISRTSWTVGSTLALTALPTARFAFGRSIGSGRSSSGCGRCPGGCPISTGVGCCVPADPYLRFDTNDYSLAPSLAGRRVEVRVSQQEVIAVALDTGELACRHVRVFARHRTVTALEHARALKQRRTGRGEPEVEIRPLARYDQLIPA